MPSDDLSRLYDFVSGTTIVADQVDAELNQLVSTSNNKVGRATTETVSGIKTFSAANQHTGNNVFSGQNTFTDATGPIKTDLIAERSSGQGVLVDSCLLQDGNVRLGTHRGTVSLANGVNTTTDVLTTDASHGLSTGNAIRVRATAGSTLPTGLSETVVYYARTISTTTITLHPSASDASGNTNRVDITATGSGALWVIGDAISPPDGLLWYNDGLKLTHLGESSQVLHHRSAGTILQVLQTVKTDTFSLSSTSWTDLTGFSATLTPKNTGNKVLIRAVLAGASDTGLAAQFRLMRDSTEIGIGDAASNRTRAAQVAYSPVSGSILTSTVIEFLDSPATTSNVTYKVQVRCNASGSIYINRSNTDSDSALYPRGSSTLTLMEVVA